jgi:hypothetical protein
MSARLADDPELRDRVARIKVNLDRLLDDGGEREASDPARPDGRDARS